MNPRVHYLDSIPFFFSQNYNKFRYLANINESRRAYDRGECNMHMYTFVRGVDIRASLMISP